MTSEAAPGEGALADAHRRPHDGVRADEGARADAGAVLVHAVVVGGDGAGADVHPLAHVGIAQVAEVMALGAGTDAAVLDLGIVAQLDVGTDVGVLADM